MKPTKSPYMTRHEAALASQPQFEKVARSLAGGNAALADDLVQEMTLSVLENKAKGKNTLGFYATKGQFKGRDALRRERIRSDDTRKGRYLPGENRKDIKQRPTPKLCKRDAPKQSKRGRPALDGTRRSAILIVRIGQRGKDLLKRWKRQHRQNVSTLVLTALELMARNEGETGAFYNADG